MTRLLGALLVTYDQVAGLALLQEGQWRPPQHCEHRAILSVTKTTDIANMSFSRRRDERQVRKIQQMPYSKLQHLLDWLAHSNG